MSSNRRGLMLAAGVATIAAGAGAGWSWWRDRDAAATDQDSAVDALWSSTFELPGGGHVAMASLRARPLVLNFWATWCPPCLREMPALDRFQRDFEDWRVFGLAADQAQPVRDFLARTPVSYPIGLAGFAGIELSRRFGNHGGGLPFSVLFGRDGRIAQRHLGELDRARLISWAQGIR